MKKQELDIASLHFIAYLSLKGRKEQNIKLSSEDTDLSYRSTVDLCPYMLAFVGLDAFLIIKVW